MFHLILSCPAAHLLCRIMLVTLPLYAIAGLDCGELFVTWGAMVFRHAPIYIEGSVNNNNNVKGQVRSMCYGKRETG